MGDRWGQDTTRLDQAGCRLLADAIGAAPDTVIPVHCLRYGFANAWSLGPPGAVRAALVQHRFCPREPTAFGTDPDTIVAMLARAEPWDCVNVEAELAGPVGGRLASATGRPVRYYGDVYHTLTRAVHWHAHPWVRRLLPSDARLLAGGPREIRLNVYGGPEALLSAGVAAAAVREGQILSIARTAGRAGDFVEIGADTVPEWRGRGLASACAATVAGVVQRSGGTPVWSAGEGNTASLRIAQKLGFREVLRRVYVIAD
jgi:RimJ/RimL family protein N-acetyltransferase